MSQNYKGIPDEDVERLLQKLEYNAAKGLVSDFATVISLRGYMHRCIQRCSTISSRSSLSSKSSDPAQPTRRTLPMNDEWMMNDVTRPHDGYRMHCLVDSVSERRVVYHVPCRDEEPHPTSNAKKNKNVGLNVARMNGPHEPRSSKHRINDVKDAFVVREMWSVSMDAQACPQSRHHQSGILV